MVTQASATSVMVLWTVPTDLTGVTGYRIFYTENGGNEQSRSVNDASRDMDIIFGLTTGSTYFITIVTISDGLLSERVEAKTIKLGMKV